MFSGNSTFRFHDCWHNSDYFMCAQCSFYYDELTAQYGEAVFLLKSGENFYIGQKRISYKGFVNRETFLHNSDWNIRFHDILNKVAVSGESIDFENCEVVYYHHIHGSLFESQISKTLQKM